MILETIKEFIKNESTPLEQRLFVIANVIITFLSFLCLTTSILLNKSIILNILWAFFTLLTIVFLILTIKDKYELARKATIIIAPLLIVPSILLVSRSLSLSIAFSCYLLTIVNIFAIGRERYIVTPVFIATVIITSYFKWYNIDLWINPISTEISFLHWSIEIALILIGTAGIPTYASDALRRKNEELANLLCTDNLTNLYNKTHLNTQLPQLLSSAQRNNIPLSILAIDIDYFKKYNDNYGHLAGDDALADVATIFKEIANRSTDSAYRFGGEEFIIILSSTDTDEAMKIGQDIIDSLALAKLEHTESSVGYITVSIGISTQGNNNVMTADKILKQADTALYESKHNGRNRYSVYKEIR